MSVEIEWIDPPPDGRDRNRWPAVAEALRGRPGEWARVAKSRSTSTVGTIRRHMAPEEYEVVTRQVSPQKFDIYVRYTGEASP